MPAGASNLQRGAFSSGSRFSSSASLSIELRAWINAGIFLASSERGICIWLTSCRKAVIIPKVTAPLLIPYTPQRNAAA